MSRRPRRRRSPMQAPARVLTLLTLAAIALAIAGFATFAGPGRVATATAATASAGSATPSSSSAATPSGSSTSLYTDDLGVKPGVIKHVWLIILENKSYDASFTGLNDNTYLWHTLPSQGVLLKNYYATGHSSQDNYTSLVSGQAPQPDVQDDCINYDNDSNASTVNGVATDQGVDKSGAVTSNGVLNWDATFSANNNYGQWTSGVGANAYVNNYGCVYPGTAPSQANPQGTGVQTLFNQLDQAGVSWKGYAEDLGDSTQSGAAVTSQATASNLTLDEDSCGAPFQASGESSSSPTYPVASPGANPSVTEANPGSANASSAYVPKHFPFPWFQSLLSNPSDCNASHIGPMFDDPTTESAGQNTSDFYTDLQSDATSPSSYPNFVWMTPDNCSDAHDAECVNNGSYSTPTGTSQGECTDPVTGGGCSEGGNLSGGWDAADIPKAPTNSTGGLYASDTYLQHVIPEIEASPEYKQGGLIDVTFDEGYPPFTYNNSFYNDDPTSSIYKQPAGTTDGFGAQVALQTDAAAQTIDPTETGTGSCPSVPNTTSDAGYLQSNTLANGDCEQNFEPTGPSTPITEGSGSTSGEQLSPGPGDSAGLDRPDNCAAESASSPTWNGTTCFRGPQAGAPNTSTTSVPAANLPAAAGTYWVQDNSIKVTDEGRPVTGSGTSIPAGAYVGPVVAGPTGSCTPPSGTTAPTCSPSALDPTKVTTSNTSTGFQENGWFELISASCTAQQTSCQQGATPLDTTASASSITLGAFCDPTPVSEGGPATTSATACASGQLQDPYYDGTTPTYGGGQTGSVLISPYITPGTSSTVFYNHYSWLRTIEDLFAVGSSSPGLDGMGHIGFAAQPGLVPFGTDVFTNAPGTQPVVISEVRYGGSGDNYVDLANTSGSAVNIGGWTLSVALSNGSTTTVTIPSGTSVPANGHYLIADTNYSGSTTPDQSQSFGGTPVGAQLLTSGTTPQVADEVGYSSAPAGYSSGVGLTAPANTPRGAFAWVRNYANGALVDTGNNATDFSFVSANAADVGDPTVGSPILGAPDPEDLGSPVVHNDVLQSGLLNPSVSASSYPNLSYNSSNGTLDINRTVTNCSGQPTTGACASANPGSTALTATRLQFRVTGLTTSVLSAQNSPGGTFSGATVAPLSVASPADSSGAGLNSELVATASLPAGGLAPGKSINVEFQFHVNKSGAYVFAYNTEDDLEPVTTGTTGSSGSSSSGTSSATAPTASASGAAVEPVVSGAVSAGTTKVTANSPQVPTKKAKKHATKKKAKKHTTKRAKKHTTKQAKRHATGRHTKHHAAAKRPHGDSIRS